MIIKNKLDIKVDNAGVIYRRSEYQIEFYPLKMSDVESEISYGKFMELVDERKSSLKMNVLINNKNTDCNSTDNGNDSVGP